MELFNRSPTLGFRFTALLVLALFLMVVDHHGQHLSRLRDVFTILVSPIRYAVDLPIRLADQIQERFVTHQHLLTENQKLRATQLTQAVKLQKYLSLQKENQQLRALLKTSQEHAETVTVAHLMAVDTNPYVHQFTLAKGARDGVFSGQAVMDVDGVLGQVIKVGVFTSQVLLLTDNRSSIPIENTRTGVRGIVMGQGSTTHMLLRDVPKTADVVVGDLLVTTGLGKRFPGGYPVGVVARVDRHSSDHFAEISVEPRAKFNRSRLVLLVWPSVK
jgi:rod shape-determining protein MreC